MAWLFYEDIDILFSLYTTFDACPELSSIAFTTDSAKLVVIGSQHSSA